MAIDPVSLHHVAVCVTDVERARQFYESVIGLTAIARPDFDFDGVWFGLPGGGQLHLIHHRRPRTLRGTREIDSRDGHLALRVGSYHRTIEHLRALGVDHVARYDNRTPWAQIYLTDPDGNVVELNTERESDAADPLRDRRDQSSS